MTREKHLRLHLWIVSNLFLGVIFIFRVQYLILGTLSQLRLHYFFWINYENCTYTCIFWIRSVIQPVRTVGRFWEQVLKPTHT